MTASGRIRDHNEQALGRATRTGSFASGESFGAHSVCIALAVAILIFSNDNDSSVMFQAAGVALIGTAAMLCLINGKASFQEVSIADILILLMVAFSLVASAVNQEIYVFSYTIIFLCTYISIMVLVRSMTADEVGFCIVLAICASLLVVVPVYFSDILTTLSPLAANRWQLRLRPFNMHPNLTGFVYGGFAVIILFSKINLGRFTVPFKAVAATLCVLIVAAASARAGLLAFVVAIAAHVIRNVVFKGKNLIQVAIAGVVGIAVIAVYRDAIVHYLSEIMELQSSTRGLDSGGSGRVEVWDKGLAVLSNRTWELIIGSGLRSSSDEILGFHTENSYITMLIDSGIVIPASLLIYFLYLSIRLHSFELKKGDKFSQLCLYALIFACVQSVFNRYLIAIGNPFSLAFLILLSKAALRV
jgi:exopolysaccharide production protein ExoQ